MATFTDCKGREWDFKLTVGLLTEVREATGVKLGEILRSETALSDFLFADPETVGRVMWCCCREQAEAAGVAPESFAAGFDGPTLEAATEAFLGSVADFFPRSKIGAAIKANLPAVLAKADERGVRAVEAAVKKLG